MKEQVSALVVELFDDACIKQFESVGCSINSVSQGAQSNEMMYAYISAGGSHLSISVLLKVPRVLLAQTMPVVEEETVNDPRYQEDWSLELANRLLGRLKNKLLPYGCRLKIGLPEVLNEKELHHQQQNTEQETGRFFDVSTEMTQSVVECRLYIKVLDDSMVLMSRPTEGDESEEGQIVFL